MAKNDNKTKEKKPKLTCVYEQRDDNNDSVYMERSRLKAWEGLSRVPLVGYADSDSDCAEEGGESSDSTDTSLRYEQIDRLLLLPAHARRG